MKKDDVPDFIPGMQQMPADLRTLKACLQAIQKQVKMDISPANRLITFDLTEEFLNSIRDTCGKQWPPIAFLLTATILETLLDKYAQEVVIEDLQGDSN